MSGTAGTLALFVGLGLLMAGNGLNGAVIGVRSSTEGFGVVVSGIIMAGFFAGFLLSPSYVVRVIPAVGHIRVFAGLASTASTAVLIHSVSILPLTWVLMRFVFGFCMAGLYIVIESWLGAMTDVNTRGRTMAMYMVVSMGGLGVGQYLVAVTDPDGFTPFVISSALVSMSLVPITLAATTRSPSVVVPDPISIRELFSIVPAGVVGTFMSGVTAGTTLGLGAVYASTIGLSLERTASFLAAPMIGAIVLQWPIGRLSDHVSRRAVLVGVAGAAAVISGLLMMLSEQSPMVLVGMLALGGTLFPLYSLVISYSLDWAPDAKMVGASSTLVRINGGGALLGPLIAAPLMSEFGPRWFFGTMTVAFSVIVVYVTLRILFREGAPVASKTEFVPFSSRAGSLALGLVKRPGNKAAKTATGHQPE